MKIDIAQLLTVLAIITGPGGLLIALMTRKKTKADAMSIIDQAAANQVLRMQEEAERWHRECHELRGELEIMRGRIDENDACQTTLKGQLTQLEIEKRVLLEEVSKLRNRVQLLEEENQRLKLIADKVNA